MSPFDGYALGRRMVAVGVRLLALPPIAGARKLQMSGTWAIRNGGNFLPLQFAPGIPGPQNIYTSMGELSKVLGYPNGPILGNGLVTATGSGPATLRVPQHRFQTSPFGAVTLHGVTLVQLTTMFVFDAPFQAATFAAGGGPGSFTWCPNAVVGCPRAVLRTGGAVRDASSTVRARTASAGPCRWVSRVE